MAISREFLIRHVLAATVFSVCLFIHSAIAATVVVDDSVFGADSVLRDTTNNIEFLRLDLTMGYGYAGIVTEFGAGGAFEGWGVASETDMLALGSSVGLTDGSADPNQVALAQELRDWFCPVGTCVLLTSVSETARGLISDTVFIDFLNEERQLALSLGHRLNVDPNEVSFHISGYDYDGTNEEVWLVRPAPLSPTVDLSGTIKTLDGTDICAMVLASGQFTFSCNPVGMFSLTDLPREQDGTVKRQIYADGFLPKIDILTSSSNDADVMARSGTCPSYNTPYDPAVVPGSAGERINIIGQVLLQNSQTPICAMVLANGQYMFACDGSGNYALNIPLDNNGQYKLQVYADGFAPTIQTFDEFQAVNDVRMARAVECQ